MAENRANSTETSHGIYIVIEGQDGTGKSTQVEKLAEYFHAKFENSEAKFQNSAKLSEKINQKIVKKSKNSDKKSREILIINEGAEEKSGLISTDAIGKILHAKDFALDPATNLLLFTAQRNELWKKKIAPALEKNAIVLASRSWWSTLAYQHFGEGVSRELIERMTRDFLPPRYLTPDKSVILTIDDATRNARVKARNSAAAGDAFDSRANDFFANVNRGYEQIARELDIPIVDAGGTIDEVFANICKQLKL